MRRKFTREEFRTFIADGKRQGVIYSKKEKRFLKKVNFKSCFICPDGEGMILIDPIPSPLDKKLPSDWGTAADLSDERSLH